VICANSATFSPSPYISFGRINADEALRLGLVSSVVEPDQLMSHAVALAQKIARHSHPVVAKAKECVNMTEEVGLTSGLAYERYVRYALSCKGRHACFCAPMSRQDIIIIDIRSGCSHVIVCVLCSAGSDARQRDHSDTYEQHWLMQARVLVVLCFT